MDEPILSVQNISKEYRIYSRPIDRLKEIITRGRKVYHHKIIALNNINFSVKRGTTFGIMGRNGSGKSTLLQIIAGTLTPSTGEVRAKGRISALLELGTGFNPEFTGVENVFFYGTLLGLSRSFMEKKLDQILDFADIGEFVNEQIKVYSSGMLVRLAFAVASAVEPDIFLIDEALAVGDARFQHKCILKIKEIIQRGTTVVFVSHDISTVKMLCSEAILLEEGRVVGQGKAEEVAELYHKILFETDSGVASVNAREKTLTNEQTNKVEGKSFLQIIGSKKIKEFEQMAEKVRFGSGEAKIIYSEVLDSTGNPTTSVWYGENIT
ncbi:MAG: ATP-binding cassette domain-containing protein, partial [Candidatus Dadabacteria bacterium]